MIEDRLRELEDFAAECREESTLRQQFVGALEEFLREAGVAGVTPRLEERLITGRSDARFGKLVFELKLPPPRGAGVDGAVEQCRRYIASHRQRAELVRGVAYDGSSLVLLDQTGTEVSRGRAADEASLLESWLLALAATPVTSDDVIAAFGADAPQTRVMVKLLWDMFREHSAEAPFVQETFGVWRAVYGRSANLSDKVRRALARGAARMGIKLEGSKRATQQHLFALQTYLSVLLKLLLARVCVQKRLTPGVSILETLENGEYSRFCSLDRQLPLLRSLFEYDVFTWFKDIVDAAPQYEPAINDALAGLARTIDKIDLVQPHEDFLRSVYHKFFDAQTRKALGEFYTDSAIVNRVLDLAGYTGAEPGIVLDFCCGSGTFLTEVIKRVLAQKGDLPAPEQVELVTRNVVGVDIHPFAVAMFRVNYFLALAALLDSATLRQVPSFSIPVYWTDALALLDTDLAGTTTVRVGIPGFESRIELPAAEYLNGGAFFDDVRDIFRKLGSNASWEAVWNRARAALPEQTLLQFEPTIRAFLRFLHDRERHRRDMRWLPFIRNLLVLRQLQGKVAYAVGNPPWVRVHNIEPGLRNYLRNRYKSCGTGVGWVGSHVGHHSRAFGAQIDYCLPFVERALQLLEPGGRLGLVVTSKLHS